MVSGETSFFVSQLRVAYGSDEGPVVPDWTVLQSGHHEIQALQLHAGKPARREEMTLAASDERVESEPVPEDPRDEHSTGYHPGGETQGASHFV
jgi:hypothetical protein